MNRGREQEHFMDTPRRPKLLIVTSNETNGGSEQVAINLARMIAARGWVTHYGFPCTPHSDQLIQWCRDAGVDGSPDPAVLVVDWPHTARDLLAFCHYIHVHKPDVVNLHYGHNFIRLADVLAVRMAGRHRLVVTVNHPAPWCDLRRRVLTGASAILCSALIVICRATQGILAQAGVPSSKIHIIHPGIQHPPRLPTQAEARARLGLLDTVFVVSTLSRLVPEKGIVDLIEAIARMPRSCGEIRVIIGGEGPERKALERLATERLGDVATFLGYVPDTADLYAAADVFVLPSEMEGFGLVYVEAALHGVPSVGTAAGGTPEAIIDGETGLLVPVHDPNTLSAAISRLRDDPVLRRRLGANARRRALAEFSEAKMADRYMKVLSP